MRVHYFEVESLQHICNAAENTKRDGGRGRLSFSHKRATPPSVYFFLSVIPLFVQKKKNAFTLKSRALAEQMNSSFFVWFVTHLYCTHTHRPAPFKMCSISVTFTSRSCGGDFTSYKLMRRLVVACVFLFVRFVQGRLCIENTVTSVEMI